MSKKSLASFQDLGPVLDYLAAYGQVIARDGARVTLRVPKAETARVTGRLLADLPVVDLTVENPSIEDVIDRVFREQSA